MIEKISTTVHHKPTLSLTMNKSGYILRGLLLNQNLSNVSLVIGQYEMIPVAALSRVSIETRKGYFLRYFIFALRRGL